MYTGSRSGSCTNTIIKNDCTFCEHYYCFQYPVLLWFLTPFGIVLKINIEFMFSSESNIWVGKVDIKKLFYLEMCLKNPIHLYHTYYTVGNKEADSPLNVPPVLRNKLGQRGCRPRYGKGVKGGGKKLVGWPGVWGWHSKWEGDYLKY